MSAAAWVAGWPRALRLGGVWRERLDALPPRVRLLGFAVAAVLLGALADMLVWAPALQTHRAVAAAERARAQELAALQALPPPAAASGPGRREQLTAELNDIRQRIAQLRDDPPASAAAAPAADGPVALPAVLQRALPTPAGPALVSLAGAAPTAAASAPAVTLRLRGRYAELQQHLAEMSRRDATQAWPAWELDARQEPPLLLLQHGAGGRP